MCIFFPPKQLDPSLPAASIYNALSHAKMYVNGHLSRNPQLYRKAPSQHVETRVESSPFLRFPFPFLSFPFRPPKRQKEQQSTNHKIAYYSTYPLNPLSTKPSLPLPPSQQPHASHTHYFHPAPIIYPLHLHLHLHSTLNLPPSSPLPPNPTDPTTTKLAATRKDRVPYRDTGR